MPEIWHIAKLDGLPKYLNTWKYLKTRSREGVLSPIFRGGGTWWYVQYASSHTNMLGIYYYLTQSAIPMFKRFTNVWRFFISSVSYKSKLGYALFLRRCMYDFETLLLRRCPGVSTLHIGSFIYMASAKKASDKTDEISWYWLWILILIDFLGTLLY